MTAAWFPQTDIEHAMQHEIDTLKSKLADWEGGLPMRSMELITALEAMGGENVRAENDRLREALEEILQANAINDEIAINLIARAALQGSEMTPKRDFDGTTPDYWAGYDAGVSEERERGAKIAEKHSHMTGNTGDIIAAAIRSADTTRGE